MATNALESHFRHLSVHDENNDRYDKIDSHRISKVNSFHEALAACLERA